MKYCFVFVCQKGELEIKSSLLAASLHYYCRCDFELVAAVPTPERRWGTILAETMFFLEKLGVKIQYIKNEISTDYPIGNKVSCLGIETQADKLIFCDSDMLLLKEFYHQSRFNTFFNAKPADLATFPSSQENWKKVYGLFGLDIPDVKFKATVSLESMPPYYNAGFIAILNEKKFYETWRKVCVEIDGDITIPNKRPFLDQIALPVTVTLLEVDVDCLGEEYNYPAHLKPISKGKGLPIFCHYHWVKVIQREPVLLVLVGKLIAKYPLLKKLLRNHEGWGELAQTKNE